MPNISNFTGISENYNNKSTTSSGSTRSYGSKNSSRSRESQFHTSVGAKNRTPQTSAYNLKELRKRYTFKMPKKNDVTRNLGNRLTRSMGSYADNLQLRTVRPPSSFGFKNRLPIGISNSPIMIGEVSYINKNGVVKTTSGMGGKRTRKRK
jgi:hypothetical protein